MKSMNGQKQESIASTHPKINDESISGRTQLSADELVHQEAAAAPEEAEPQPLLIKEDKPKVQLWYPKAVRLNQKMKTKGTYDYNYPVGAVVHFSAGRDKTEKDAENTMLYGVKSNYTYFGIGPTGKIYQMAPLNEWGSHAGVSFWPYLGKNVSSKLVGIEVICAGLLEGNKSWFGVEYDRVETRHVTEALYQCPTGNYKKFSEAQEVALYELLFWLKYNCPEVFSFDYVLGHH